MKDHIGSYIKLLDFTNTDIPTFLKIINNSNVNKYLLKYPKNCNYYHILNLKESLKNDIFKTIYYKNLKVGFLIVDNKVIEYFLDENYWNLGIISYVLPMFLKHYSSNLETYIHKKNKKSIYIIKKNGFKKVLEENNVIKFIKNID